MVVRPVLALLLVSALLSGCLADSSGAVSNDPGDASAPAGPDAGSPTSHGRARTEESGVDVDREGTTYVAEKTITVRNDFGGASRSTLDLDTLNGGIVVRAGGSGGYVLTATLQGRGSTEADARDALDLLRFTSADDLDGSTLELAFVVERIGQTPVSQLIGQQASHGASLILVVPAGPGHSIRGDTSNGGISVTGLHGPSVDLDTSNAAISVSGSFDVARLDTSNAAIELEGTFNDVVADTSNGSIHGDVEATRSGPLRLTTSNAAIRMDLVGGADTGFDVRASTSNADSSIQLDGDSDSGNDDASARSPDYAGKRIRVDVEAETSNARIDIEEV